MHTPSHRNRNRFASLSSLATMFALLCQLPCASAGPAIGPLPPVKTVDPATATARLMPIFRYALYSRGPISGSIWVNSYNSEENSDPRYFNQKGADVLACGPVTLLPSSIIFGDLNIFSPNNESNAQVLHTVANSSSYVSGDIRANGQVLGSDGIKPANVEGTIQRGTSDEPPPLMPTPAAPSAAKDLGNVALSGVTHLRLKGGVYKASSIAVKDAAYIEVDPAGGPVSIYVHGDGKSGIKLAGAGSVGKTGLPSNLRIWYDGSAPVEINNAEFSAVLFAPNADVTLGAVGSLYGAFVCKSFTASQAVRMHYDSALKDNRSLMWQAK